MSESKVLTKSYIIMLIGTLLGTYFSDQLLLRAFQLPDPILCFKYVINTPQ